MAKRGKKFFLLSFSLTFGLGLIFLNLTLPKVLAADVNVNAVVPVTSVCGDGVKEGLEVCDDHNTTDCDGCKGDCSRVDKVCGDGIKECGEQCESAADCSDDVGCNFCSCGVPCFLAGTEISLVGGLGLPIEEIKVGDLVISYNEKTKKLEPSIVLKTFKHQASQYLVINQEIKVTADHPFYINDQWLKAGQIKIGDKLLREDGQATIVSAIEIKTGDFFVYNLEVDKNHNYFAQGYLAHNKGECIPVCAGKECGSSNCPGVSCGSCGPNFNCVGGQCLPIAQCGNSIIEPGEECDDGPANSNTIPNACRTNCQAADCGDSVIDSGESCDDGNTASADCCSAVCQVEVLIRNVSESVTNTTANIGWETPCQVTTSLLEWGLTSAVSDGSISGLSGTTYSRTIGDLEPNVTYYYRITATAGSALATFFDSFHTLGGIENCNNNIDDDSDGLCDYPASICTDGSIPGDPECVCTPDFLCTPGACDILTNTQIVTCVDQTVPKCEADYEYEQDCEICPGVFCGPCQELDEEICECTNLSNCCGNDICEPPGEDPYTCLIDCPVDCLSDWECTPWQPEPCPLSGIQARECFDQNACLIPINPPALQKSCSLDCPGLTCGTCQAINIDACVCEELIPCCGNGICEASEIFEQCPKDCIEPCLPNWTCSNWGACVNGIQHRSCQDLNNCGLNLDRPPEVRSCTPGCDVACNICQQISLATCSCQAQTPCCGNHTCEITETVWSCPVDCGLPPEYRLTLTQCLDGLDNDNDGLVDFPADPGCSRPADDSEMNLAEFLQKVQDILQEQFLDNPQVEQINQIATPILIATIAINSFATFSFFNFLSYLQFFITQPFAALFRRKRRKWGVVYNALSKQPVDLAIVRLYKKENNRLIQSKVTDKLGRFSFLVDPGRYYLTVTKPKYNFPTQYLKEAKEDVKYLDLYHGETIEITRQRVTIALNIPIDPQEEVKPVAKIIFQYYLRKIQYAAAFSAIPLATISMMISPGALTFAMFSFHCLLYVLFRRLGYQKPPKSWGLVYDQGTRKPLGRAITRIYDKRYNKLLETRVTDAGGRYSFLVNNNIYYVTAEKLGYKQFKTEDIDLVSKDREAIVGIDIGLEKGKPGVIIPPESPKEVAESAAPLPLPDKIGGPAKLEPPKVSPIATKPSEPIAQVPTPTVEKPTVSESALVKKAEDLSVGRESLEELAKAKQSVQKIQEEITEKKEELEKLEDKVEEIQESIEEKLDKIEVDKSVVEKPKVTPVQEESLPKSEIKPTESADDQSTDQKPKPPSEKSIFG